MSFGIIHNLSSQRAEASTAGINESQNYLVTTQRRKRYRLTKLVDKLEIRRHITRYWKAPKRVDSRLWLLSRLAAHRNQPHSPYGPDNNHKCCSSDDGSKGQSVHKKVPRPLFIRMPHSRFLSRNTY